MLNRLKPFSMNSFLFFIGTFLRWVVNKPREFGIRATYYLIIYLLAKFSGFDPSSGVGLLFTITVVGPLCYEIQKGLPVDCLDSGAVIERERINNKLN